MELNRIDADLSVSGQITAKDVAELAKQGFKAIICNRPDGEGADQPVFKEIDKAASKHGLQAAYLPVVAGKVGDDDVAKFGQTFATLPKPVFAYCRTGTRSATLWSLADVMNTSNVKAATVARKQAPVVANNHLTDISVTKGIGYNDG